MDEYIEREALMRRIKEIHCAECDSYHGVRCRACWVDDTLGYIDSEPTADVAPVVHGRWEWFDEDVGTPVTGYEREWGWRCSHCREELPDDYDDPDDSPKFRFCYNCGAKMDGGVDNEA